jgi:acylphosphatase
MKIAFQVHGRVQGIGFRYFVRREAEALGLDGYVRNEFDGTVTGAAGGDPAAIAQFRDVLEQGSSGAWIQRLDWWPLDEGQSLPSPFTIRS